MPLYTLWYYISEVLPLVIGLNVSLVVYFLGLRYLSRRQPWTSCLPRRSRYARDIALSDGRKDRRGEPRRTVNPVPILVSNETAAVAAVHGWVMDRSSGGLGLELEEEGELEPGTLLSLRAEEMPINLPWLQVVVRHVRRLDARWRLGCEFAAPPDNYARLYFG
jgi:hypothetical protein